MVLVRPQKMAVSLSGKVRVNSISPGWIETGDAVYEGPDAAQQLVGRVGNTTAFDRKKHLCDNILKDNS